ncbi:PAS domain-containing protein [Patescibacteria group bacterium]|nr:MAG: PAS domain-containing protein [Patescibacteria group bacterium]
MQIESSNPPPGRITPRPSARGAPVSEEGSPEDARSALRRRRLETVLRESRLMRRVLRNAPVPIIVTDLDWRVRLVNLAAVAAYGYLKREFKNAPAPFVRLGECDPQKPERPVYLSDLERIQRELARFAGQFLETRTLIRLANDECEPVVLRISHLFSEEDAWEGVIIAILPDESPPESAPPTAPARQT